MRIGIVSGALANPNATVDDVIADAKGNEALGLQALSVPNIFGHDAIGACGLIGRETDHIQLLTGVVPMHPRNSEATKTET